MKKQAISRKIAGVLAVVLILAGGSGCASAELSDDFDKDTVETAAKEVVDQLNSGDYAAIEESYNAAMIIAMQGQKLQDTLQPILDKLGEFEEITNCEVVGSKEQNTKEDLAVALINVKYAEGKVRYTISFDKDMKLAGLFIK
ncbi:DUF3887 domain-containing protein [Diplocloster modestus]|uniref:DUF3887 domain-containing protein n=1 Tax=Diplocloster modestus TaxID=2850322 RepID=A0ABS6K988_9FIRM|nr:DUF3887 domain-containing protein [Diplocloster modestus]MBU9727085.1 DUF3887 domain-containing protein [Diplocloster modestus]